MDSLSQVDLLRLILYVTNYCEKSFKIQTNIDADIVGEIYKQAQNSLKSFQSEPNEAKIAGIIVFWIRKLKPIHHKAESPNKQLLINENVALLVGLSICNKNSYQYTKANLISIRQRIYIDWVKSLRMQSHSPNSMAIAFEILTCKQ
ncbi:MAG: hypothetical protein HW421_1282 [Ignavibacteria bacterium]|nr:hypothetical protein [Ignavibacteria bacterium]